MQIDIAVERENGFVNVVKGNFPIVFTFMDRTTKILINVNLDRDAF